MTNQTWEREEKKPALRWLAEIANRVNHEQQLIHGKRNDSGITYAGTHDFERAFEFPLKIIIGQALIELQMQNAEAIRSATRDQPNFQEDAMKRQVEVNKLYFEMARRDRPDER